MSLVATVLWVSVALIFHTYAGYALWLGLRARLAPRPLTKGDACPEVAVIVVAHNECERILAKIRTVLGQNYPQDKLRLVIVSDGSTDDMVARIRALAEPRVQVLEMAERRGKAACLNDAVAACHEPLLVFNDARQMLHPDAVRELAACFHDERIGAVSGELVFVDDTGQPFEKGLGAYWRLEKFIRHSEALTGSAIGVTGAIYAMRRTCFEPIDARTVLDDVLIPMNALLRGWRVGFEPRAMAYDRPSREPAQEKVRKVRTLAGNFQLMAHHPRLLHPWCNPAWGRFVAHKTLRLAGPLLLATVLVASAVLAPQSPLYAALCAVQLMLYAAVLVAWRWPALQRLPLLGLASTFVHLNVFVVLGLINFLTARQMQLWSRSPEATPQRPS